MKQEALSRARGVGPDLYRPIELPAAVPRNVEEDVALDCSCRKECSASM